MAEELSQISGTADPIGGLVTVLYRMFSTESIAVAVDAECLVTVTTEDETIKDRTDL